jgi:DUF1680 family protein
MLPTWMYLKSTDSIYVNLFIGSTVTIEDVAGTDVTIVQNTDYPWSGDVSITVNPKVQKSFNIRIRVPNHSVSELYNGSPESGGITSISVNGSVTMPPVDKGYAVITRNWKAGDKIKLTLPMKIQRIKASDKIEATTGRLALRYGPLIYCAESIDQDLNNILSPDTALTIEWNGDLLGGLMVIKGTWDDGSVLTSIPYYARSNRVRSSSTETNRRRRQEPLISSVWLKDQ